MVAWGLRHHWIRKRRIFLIQTVFLSLVSGEKDAFVFFLAKINAKCRYTTILGRTTFRQEVHCWLQSLVSCCKLLHWENHFHLWNFAYLEMRLFLVPFCCLFAYLLFCFIFTLMNIINWLKQEYYQAPTSTYDNECSNAKLIWVLGISLNQFTTQAKIALYLNSMIHFAYQIRRVQKRAKSC